MISHRPWLTAAALTLLTAVPALAEQGPGLQGANPSLAKLSPALNAQIKTAMARRATAPLAPAARVAAAQKALNAPTPPALGGTISVKPAAAYSNGVALGFTDPALVSAGGGTGMAILLPGTPTRAAGSVAVSFPAAPGKTYLIDCQLNQDATAKWQPYLWGKGGYVGGGVTASVGQHLTFVMPPVAGGAAVEMDIWPVDGGGPLILTGCDVTPVG